MPLTACRECKKEISDSAEKCPHCGIAAPGAPTAARAGAGILSMLIFGAIIWYFFLGGLEGSVASDFEKQYDMAARSGDRMQMCVQAGIVAAAYMQANDDAGYRRWSAKEDSDCRAAGVPR